MDFERVIKRIKEQTSLKVEGREGFPMGAILLVIGIIVLLAIF